MARGVLDEIELQSQRVIQQKKQEVAGLSHYKASLDQSIAECNERLATLQRQQQEAEASLKALKDQEADQLAKIKKAEQASLERLHALQAKLAQQASQHEERSTQLTSQETELARKQKNHAADVARIKSVLAKSGEDYQAIINGLTAKLG